MALAVAVSLLPERTEIIISSVEHSSVRACAQVLKNVALRFRSRGRRVGKVPIGNLEKLVTKRTAWCQFS